MFRTVISLFVIAATAIAPMSGANAESYIFRHKVPLVQVDSAPVDPETGIEVGNDVVAYYTAPLGFPFSRRIPVKTADVADWRVEDGVSASGVSLDDGAGTYSGTPDAIQTTVQRLLGYDAAGNLIAKAEVHFRVVKPEGVEVKLALKGHTNQYSYNVIPTPDGIEVAYWDETMMTMPGGMAMRNEAFEGSPAKPADYTLFLQGYDHLGRAVAFAYGSFLVTDGPVIADYPDQKTDPSRNQAFRLGPAGVTNAIGTLSYQLVALDGHRPEGLTFNSLTGAIGGVVSEFSLSARFQVKVTDSADGTGDITKPFTLTTVEPVFSMGPVSDQTFVIGEEKSLRFRSGSNMNGLVWSLDPSSGLLPDGLEIDPSTGVIGTLATKVGDWPGIVIRVDGPGGFNETAGPFAILVREQDLRLISKDLDVRVNTPFETGGITALRGKVDPLTFSLREGSVLPSGITLSADTGKLTSATGLSEPTSFRAALDALNGDGQNGYAGQTVRVHPKTTLEYAEGAFRRFEFNTSLAPAYDTAAIIGSASFSISPDLPTGLRLAPSTGRIAMNYPNEIAKAAVGRYGPFTVSMTDDGEIPVLSAPFHIDILDREALSLQPGTEGEVEVERYLAYNGYNKVMPAKAVHSWGGVTYTLASNSAPLPKGLDLHPGGYLLNSTSVAVGPYPDIRIKAVDRDGSEANFGPFTIHVVPDTALKDLAGDFDRDLTWVEGRPLKPFDLPRPINGKAPIKWELASAPEGIDIVNGQLVGTVASAGSYTVTYRISDDTAREPVTATVALTIEEPMTVVSAAWEGRKNHEFSMKPEVERGLKPITYRLLSSASLPSGWRFVASDGTVTGIVPESAGGFPVDIEITDAAGVERNFVTNVTYLPPGDVTATWPGRTLSVGETSGFPVEPSLDDKTVKMTSWAISGALPDGIGFDSGSGAFTASPYPSDLAAGIHTLYVTPTPSDPEVTLSQPSGFPATLKIGYSGDISFPGRTFTHRAGADIRQKVFYARAVAPVKVTAEALADGVSFDSDALTLAARFKEPGTYAAATLKIEENDDPAFDRENAASFSFAIVPDVALTVPGSMSFGQHDRKSVAITEILNVIGDRDETTPDVTYAPADGYPLLPEGLSVNRLTGAVEGAAEVSGTFGPFAIAAHDSYGDSKNSNEFTVTVAERQQLTVSYPSGFDHFRRYGAWTSIPAINGYGPYRYSISPALPDGLSIDPDSGAITADTDSIIEPQTYTVTAVDSKGGPKGTAEVEVALGVAERLPLGLNYGTPSIAFTRHIADSGKAPAVANRVARGGVLEFAVSPALPSCVGFDATTGTLSTDPACTAVIAPDDYTVTVTDATWRNGGNALGRTVAALRVAVQDRPAITLGYPDYARGDGFGFQRHVARTVFPEYSGEMSAVTWDIAPTPPAGISFDYDTGAITADSADIVPAAPHTITVRDAFDGETRLAVSLGVSERDQLEFEQATAQEIPLNGEYGLTLSLRNVIGENVHFDISGDLPSGVAFDTDGQGECGVAGTFCGTPAIDDHGRTFTVVVRASDNFHGDTGPVEFAFTVVEDATPMSVTYEAPAKARVGYAWSLPAPTVEHAVGNHSFAAPALAAYGLSIDPRTGIIRGTPNTTFERGFEVTVTDKLGPTRAVTSVVNIVSAPTPTVTVPNPIPALFNREVAAVDQPRTENVEGTAVWSVSPADMPPGLSFDAVNGLFTGLPTKLGTYGPYTLTLRDELPGVYPTAFSFSVAMNGDPIDLEEMSVLTKVGFPFETKAPDHDNNYGPARFSSPELAALGLSVDPGTGVVSGSLSEPMLVKPNLVIRDDTIRTTSKPVNIEVLPRMRLTAPDTVTLTALDEIAVPIKVTRTYVAGTAAWNPVDQSLLPEGVVFDTATGAFVGTPTKVQTPDPLTVSSTDTFGNNQTDTAVSNPITFVVKKGAFYMEFKQGELPVATKRSPYSFDLIASGLFEFEGMDRSEIVWGLEDGSGSLTPEQIAAKTGLSVVHGVLTGTPADEGKFDVVITAKFADRAPVNGRYLLNMVLPATELGLSSDSSIPDGTKSEEYSFDFKSRLSPLVNIPADKVAWSYVFKRVTETDGVTSADVIDSIAGITFDTVTGAVNSDKVDTSGQFIVEVTATFDDRTEHLSASASYSFLVKSSDVEYTQLTASNENTCGVTTTGNVMCWGSNSFGQLGAGSTSSTVIATTPVKVLARAGLSGFVEGATGVYSSAFSGTFCAVASSELVCWGSSANKQIGTSASYTRPIRRQSPSVQGGVGTDHICSLSGGSVMCSGSNVSYQMANGIVGSTSGMNGTQFSSGYARLFAGGLNTCGIKDGVLNCVGENQYYNLGRGGTSTTDSGTPSAVTGLVANEVADLSIGNNHMCALTSSGGVKCWGDNAQKQIGGLSTKYSTPQSVSALASGVRQVSAGGAHTCAVKTDGTVWCWGRNMDGQIGTGAASSGSVGTPAKVVGLPAGMVSVTSGNNHSCAIDGNGKAWCWGKNDKGQLGNETTANSAVPVLVASP